MNMVSIRVVPNKVLGLKKQELLKLIKVIGRRVAASRKMSYALRLMGAGIELAGAYEDGDQDSIAKAKHTVRSIMSEPG